MLRKLLYRKINDKTVACVIFLYVTSLLLHWSYMSPLYHSNEWSDPSLYFTIGKAIFNGQTLYTEVFDHKGPVIFFIYGLGYLISNHSFLGVFLIQIFLWTFMVFMVYRTAKLYLTDGIAYLAAFIFPFLLPASMKTGGSAEEFILVFECISLYYFVSYFKDKDASIHNPYAMLVHGIMFSLVAFCKINLAVFWFFPIAGIFLNLLLKKSFKNFFLNGLAFLGGVLIIALPICLYLSINNALDEFYSVYIELNKKYSDVYSVGRSLLILLARVSLLQTRPFELFLLPSLGVFYFPFKYIDNKLGKYVFVLAGVSLYATIFIVPSYLIYYPIPFLVFSALGIITVFAFINKHIVQYTAFTVRYLILVFVILFPAGLGLKSTFDEKTTDFMKENPGLFTKNMYRKISREKNPTLLVLNSGLGNNLFITCRIMPNVRFFTSPNLAYDFYPTMRDEQTEYIKNKKTQFIVLSVPTTDKLYAIWKIERPDNNSTGSNISSAPKRNLVEDNYAYFSTLPALKENYELCLRDTIVNTFENKVNDIYELYKRKN